MKKGIQSWKNLLRFIEYFFSIRGLIKTLFVPWRRDAYIAEPGIWGFIEKIGFIIITRLIGFFIRSITIIIGIIIFIFIFLSFPVFFFLPLEIKFENLVKLGSLGRTWAYPITYILDKHGKDLAVIQEYLVIDHDHSIEQIERTLSKQANQNILIIGSQGIGKTTRLAYLARKMYRDLSTQALNGKRLVRLFPEELSAEEFLACVKDAVHAKNVVLVIENIERFKIIPLIQPYLQDDHFQIILSTNFNSYHTELKHNDALIPFVEVVEFYPPDDEITLLYLMDWCKVHKVENRFPQETLSAIIILTDKLVMNDYQPEKSIHLLEELVGLSHEKISTEDVENLISKKTGIPLGMLQKDEKEKLLQLEEILKSHVIGQDEAVKAIASALKRSRTGVTDSQKPIGSFLFLGTTGVGKTHTAKMLAQYYFGGEHLMTRFDMSEFRELNSMNRFIETLSAKVEENPYSLVFFDEIEKSHPDILNLFLQILDEGKMHSPEGRLISFRNTIIICTSNAGSSYMMQNDVHVQDLVIEHIISNGILRPEFINRFDASILFNALDRNAIKQITLIILNKLNRHFLKEKNILIDITEELVENLAREGHDLKFGVRPLQRIVQNVIETQIADFLLKSDITPYFVCVSIDISSLDKKYGK